MRKTIVFVVLGIPVLIAVILKFFGESQFEIPIFYMDGISNSECGLEQMDQYYLTSIDTQEGNLFSFEGNITIVYFQSQLNNYAKTIDLELSRMMLTKAMGNGLKICVISDSDYQEVAGSETEQTVLEYNSNALIQIANCKLLLPKSEIGNDISYETITLIDDSGRIRGYFDGKDEEEFDRLSAEIDILSIEDK